MRLEVKDLRKSFGEREVLHGISKALKNLKQQENAVKN